MSNAESEKQQRLSKEEWKAQEENAIRVKFASPRRRAWRTAELERRIKSHRRQILQCKNKYEKLICNAGFELAVLRELDDRETDV